MSDGNGETEVDDTSPKSAAGSERFDGLLARLADDGNGALAYERLRGRLTAFFRLRFAVHAEALADEALDRLARRLAEGVLVESPMPYVLGIARRLAQETEARQRRERNAAREIMAENQPFLQDDPELDLRALRECLEAAGPEAAGLIIEYYAAETGARRIEQRRLLAARLGLTLNGLRNRALRIRMGLERCVRARIDRDETAHRPTSSIMDDDGYDETH